MNCQWCNKETDSPIDGRFCSADCRAIFEHEQKVRENRWLSINVSSLDDGSASLEIHLRDDEGFSELTKRSDTLAEGLREIAKLCLSVAEDMEDENE